MRDTRDMPLPRLLARTNRLAANRVMLGLVGRPPFAALSHLGRRSGDWHRIPINAFPWDGGFVFALVYGRDTDWVRNVLAAGRARLEYGGDRFELVGPRIVPLAEVEGAIPLPIRPFLRLVGAREALVVHVATF